MRLLIAIITLISMACAIGVLVFVLKSVIGVFMVAGPGYFVWLRFARQQGLVD
jgi:hypothetical protein